MKMHFAVAAAALSLWGCPKPCTHNYDCNDGLYCNGVETCNAGGYCDAGTPVACDDGIDCTADRCSEERQTCEHAVPDVDGDGRGDARCVDSIGTPLGDDCDDHDPLRAPGQVEVCDDHHDEDCDPTTLGGKDTDLDGYVDHLCGNTLVDGGVAHGTDCDDSNPAVHPGQAELCNNVDDNCDGTADEGVRVARYADLDGDGYGAGPALQVCATDPFVSPFDSDCDDTNPAMHPGEFRCVVGGQGIEYELCQNDGGFLGGVCPASKCLPQPNGTAVCQ